MYVNSYFSDGTQDVYAEKLHTVHVVVAPQYNASTLYNDLAALVLDRPSSFTPISLPDPGALLWPLTE